MSRNDQLQDLLDRWDALRAEGNQISAEELCRDCPELTDDLRRHLDALKAMAWLEESETEAADQPGEESRSVSPLPLRAGYEPVAGFRLLDLLGRGGFGEVWKAIGPGGVEVALKVVPLAERAGTVELRALDAVKNIRHPNLLAVFGAWQVNGLLIVAMELAERTLLDRLEETRQKGQAGIPRAELLEYLEDAARGIDFLNEPRHAGENGRMIGIQHRDIKPANLVLVGGRVKVADFGLARLFTETGTGHSGHMTPAYAAPEFFDGKMHARSDQYSLAVTYCLLRGGRLPFEGSAAEVMAGHLHREPDLSMQPEQERPIVARALGKNPEERWPNCRAFVKALRSSSAPELPRWTGQRRFVARASLFCLAAALLIGIGLVTKYAGGDRHRDPHLDPTASGIDGAEDTDGSRREEKPSGNPPLSAPAASPAPELVSVLPDEEGFVRLDNGKDLTGWTGNKKGWSVRNGVIHVDVKTAPVNGTIYSEKVPSRNCVIRLQYRVPTGTFVGRVFIHGTPFSISNFPVTGPKTYAQAARPTGEWNDLEFDLKGGLAVIRLNGQVVEKGWKLQSAASQGIGLQRYTGHFDYRNIRFKDRP